MLYVFAATAARRMLVADLAPRETVMRTITDNKFCCEFATRLRIARSLHRLSFSTGPAPSDAEVLHRVSSRCVAAALRIATRARAYDNLHRLDSRAVRAPSPPNCRWGALGVSSFLLREFPARRRRNRRPWYRHDQEGAPSKNGPPIINLTKSADRKWTVPACSKQTDADYPSFQPVTST